MPKKTVAKKPSIPVEFEGVKFKSPSWPPTSRSFSNELDSSFGDYLKDMDLIPQEAKLIFTPSDSPICCDWTADDYVCIHEYPFRLSFKLPLEGSIKDILKTVNCALGQFLPHFWRVLFSFECLKDDYNIDWNYNVFRTIYYTRKYGESRVGVRCRTGIDRYVPIANTSEDREWGSYFFFVKKSSLGPVADFLRTTWRVGDIEDRLHQPSKQNLSLAKRILKIPVNQRRYPRPLGFQPYRSHFDFVASQGVEQPLPEEKVIRQEVATPEEDQEDEESESDQQDPDQEVTITGVNIAVSPFKSSVNMSSNVSQVSERTRSRKFQVIDDDKAFESLLIKRKVEGPPEEKEKIAAPVTRAATSSRKATPSAHVEKKRKTGTAKSLLLSGPYDLNEASEVIGGRLSADLCHLTDEKLDHLSKAEIKERALGHTYHAFQAILAAIREDAGEEDVIEALQQEKADLEKSNKELNAKAKQLEEACRSLAKERELAAAQISRHEGQIAELEGQVAEKNASEQELSVFYTWSTKLTLMREFAAGQTAHWDLPALEEKFRRVFPSTPTGAEEAEVNSAAVDAENVPRPEGTLLSKKPVEDAHPVGQEDIGAAAKN